jgi:ketosteroid isomerase-like protein
MMARLGIVALISIASVGCSRSASSARDAHAGIDSLNARLVSAYRNRDPQAYAALFTDSAMFEWPAFETVHGPAALGAMAKSNWAAEHDVDLRLVVYARRLAADHATEFGAFQQSWTDSSGVRMTEFGRYATDLSRQPDGAWRMDRWLGFEDSTRRAAR